LILPELVLCLPALNTFCEEPGIGLLHLDADCNNSTVLHCHGTTGGSWIQSKPKLIAMLG